MTSETRWIRLGLWLSGIGVLCSVISLSAFTLSAYIQATPEDDLRLQVVLLRGQLAEAMKATAKCEADGSQANQQLQKAQTEGQALVKALEARGLMVDPQTNAIVPKPKEKP